MFYSCIESLVSTQQEKSFIVENSKAVLKLVSVALLGNAFESHQY